MLHYEGRSRWSTAPPQWSTPHYQVHHGAFSTEPGASHYRRICRRKITSPPLSSRMATLYHLFVRSPPCRNHLHHPDDEEPQPVVTIPYVSGVSEWIRKASEKFNLKVVFKSSPTLRSLLTSVKDPLPMEKLARVVYQIPCQCGKVYVGETQRRLETQVKEHKDACSKGHAAGSTTHYRLGGNQGARQGHKACSAAGKGSLVHSENPYEQQAQLRWGLRVTRGCWIATMKELGGRSNTGCIPALGHTHAHAPA